MPNFWTKAGQFITEAISNNKTQDEDYKELCNQMTKTELGINSLKNILKNYNTYSEPFYKYIQTLNEALNQIYKDSPLTAQIENITIKHGFILDDLNNLNKIISKLYSKTSEWDTIFEKAKELQKIREEKRKNFDHYEQKLLKIEGDQNKKKNTELLIRNQEKYSKALKEYLDISEKSFEIIKTSIKLSWELTNPIISELCSTEQNIFERFSIHLGDFSKTASNLDLAMKKAFNPENPKGDEINSSYDPKRCIRSQTLMKRNDDTNYEHIFNRYTNTFGNIPQDRWAKFLQIKDGYPYN